MAQLQFTILQANIAWQNAAANREHFTLLINAIEQATQVVLLPEMFNIGFTMDTKFAETIQGETIAWMQQLAAEKKIIIGGSLLIEEDNQFYNRFVWMQPNGVFHCYNKRHLFSLANEHKVFTAGQEKMIVQVNGIKICLQICYDLRFPVFVRQQKNHAYDVIIYVANWPEKRVYAWQQLLIARAIENQCFVIGVNRVGTDGNDWQFPGSSMVLDALGNVLHQLDASEQICSFSINTQEIIDVRNSIPFLNDGDDFVVVLE
jgi:omega-amidase